MIISKPAPQFKSQAAFKGQISDFDMKNQEGKWTLLLFYPLDFTFVCPTELIAFSEAADKFKAVNADIFGISIDSVYSHLAWDRMPRKQGGLGTLNFPLIEDIDKGIASAYEVLMDDGKALRGLFIIDDKGIVQAANINNLDVGRSVDEALRLVQAYQHSAKNGSVCPANWKPGDKDMQADPEKSQAYFSSTH